MNTKRKTKATKPVATEATEETAKPVVTAPVTAPKVAKEPCPKASCPRCGAGTRASCRSTQDARLWAYLCASCGRDWEA